MQKQIQIGIQGPQSSECLSELLALPGLSGKAEPVDDTPLRSAAEVLTAVGVIFGILGNAAGIAMHIALWRDKWKARQPATALSVVIEDATGQRWSLHDASPEQIVAILQTLNR